MQLIKKANIQILIYMLTKMADEAGFEPATKRLTVSDSTNWRLINKIGAVWEFRNPDLFVGNELLCL